MIDKKIFLSIPGNLGTPLVEDFCSWVNSSPGYTLGCNPLSVPYDDAFEGLPHAKTRITTSGLMGCNMVVLFPGWEQSRYCILEAMVSRILGSQILAIKAEGKGWFLEEIPASFDFLHELQMQQENFKNS